MSARATALHETPWRGVFYLTGGGSGLLSEMLSTPGASATVLEAAVPYAAAALAELLDGSPEQAVSAATARQLAATAFHRATILSGADATAALFGFGATAALATNRTKKGEHRAHWAIQTGSLSAEFSLVFDKAANDRAAEEENLIDAIWQSLQAVLVGGAQPPQPVQTRMVAARDNFSALLRQAPYKTCVGEHRGQLLLPGSFNPIHDGHRQLLATAEQLTGLEGAYELAVKNADKPSLDYISLEHRLAAITDAPVWLTNTARFSDKAGLFPGATFALGVDTMERVGDVRFYQGHRHLLDAAIDHLAQCQVRFLVFGRVHGKRFVTLEQIELPPALRALCSGVAESTYRNDLSSTAVRNRNK